jgi:ribonuclease HII
MRGGAPPDRPSWSNERRLARQGCGAVAGIDEVGRGSLAGPVVAAAVVLKAGARLPGVNDSKLLSAQRREVLMREILRNARDWGIGAADAQEIDTINILNATRRAMGRAVEALRVRPDHLLIDAVELDEVPIAQSSMIRGDRLCISIAAASIVAKVVRDRVMGFYERLFPGFGFAAHKGYGTREHLLAVQLLGASPIHRRTFRGVPRGRQMDLPLSHLVRAALGDART